MAKNTETTANGFWQELFQSGIYKRNQGRIARQATFFALALVFLLGSVRMHQTFFIDAGMSGWLLPGGVLVAGIWFVFRLVNIPRFADFLISVEAEMYKVSWPSRHELFRSALVVIVTMIGLAAILVAYDYIWMFLLGRVLGITGIGVGGG